LALSTARNSLHVRSAAFARRMPNDTVPRPEGHLPTGAPFPQKSRAGS